MIPAKDAIASLDSIADPIKLQVALTQNLSPRIMQISTQSDCPAHPEWKLSAFLFLADNDRASHDAKSSGLFVRVSIGTE